MKIAQGIGFLLLNITCFAQGTDAVSYNKGNYHITDGQKLSEVLADIGTEHNIILAYPSSLIADVQLSPADIKYDNSLELLKQLLSPFDLQIKQNSANTFLVRRGHAEEKESPLVVEGRVTDGATGRSLPYASIYISDFSNGTFSDDQGNFRLEISPRKSDKELYVSFISYETLKFDISSLQPGKINIAMQTVSQPIEDIIVAYVIPPLSMNKNDLGLSLSGEGVDILNNDLMRGLQLLPGIAAHNDNSSRLSIRGSNTDQSRIILDGMPLYNVDHYYGVFSSINADYVDEITVYKNAQPIELPAAGGGVVTMNSGGVADDFSFVTNIDLLQSSLNADIPLSDKLSFHIGGRTTYKNVDDGGLISIRNKNDRQGFQLGDTNNFLANNPDFRFFDINASLRFRTGNRSYMSYNIFHSKDKYINSFDLNFETHPNKIYEASYLNDEIWENFAQSLLYDYDISNVLSWHSQLFYTRYDQESLLSSSITEIRGNDKMNFSYENQNHSLIEDMGFCTHLASSFKTHNFKAGLSFNDFSSQNLNRVDDSKIIEKDFDAKLWTVFGSYILNSGKWGLELGARNYIYSSRTYDDFLPVPQMNITYELSPSDLLKFSASRSYQFLREIEYETRQSQTIEFYSLADNKPMPALRTDKIMAGYSRQWSSWLVDIEFFAKQMDGILQLTTVRPGVSHPNMSNLPKEYTIYKGKRNVTGLDFLVSYKNKSYSAWLSYTLSESLDAFKQIFKGRSFASEDDRRHQLQFFHEWETGPFKFSHAFIFASGKPYLSLDMLDTNRNRSDLDPDRFIQNLPDYIRMDLGVDYGFEVGQLDLSLGISVFNVFNRENVKYLQYAYRIEDEHPSGGAISRVFGAEADLLDRTVNLNFKLEF